MEWGKDWLQDCGLRWWRAHIDEVDECQPAQRLPVCAPAHAHEALVVLRAADGLRAGRCDDVDLVAGLVVAGEQEGDERTVSRLALPAAAVTARSRRKRRRRRRTHQWPCTSVMKRAACDWPHV